jgi:hypothetical protein
MLEFLIALAAEVALQLLVALALKVVHTLVTSEAVAT